MSSRAVQRTPADQTKDPTYKFKDPTYKSKDATYTSRDPTYNSKDPLNKSKDPTYKFNDPTYKLWETFSRDSHWDSPCRSSGLPQGLAHEPICQESGSTYGEPLKGTKHI